jgi:hypothetical protein
MREGNGTHDGPSATPAKPWALRNYAFLGDGERGALVDPDGALVWLCAPRWDSDGVISQLIGGPGGFLVRPQEDWRVWGGSYEDGTLIRVNRWVSAEGVVECREALAMPADPRRVVVLRRVRAVSGDARMDVALDVRPGFGAHRMERVREADGVWTASAGGMHVRLTGLEGPVPQPDGGFGRKLVVPEGGEHDIVLEISDHAGSEPLDPGALWRATERRWRDLVPSCDELAASRDSRHAYAVLTGLTSAAGGMAAAATSSLPERAGTGRNYDYRFSWIRDQVYAGLAVAAHGPHPLLENAVRFVTERVLEDGPRLRAAYTVDGRPVPSERTLRLTGYPGGTDKVGNDAGEQFQLDAYGEVLQLLAAAARLECLDADGLRAMDVAAKAVEENWQRPDAGVWELEDRWWTHSRLCAAAGLRAAATAVPGPAAAERRWLADGIARETRRRCLHPSGYWQRAEDDPGVDAALLMAFVRGALRPGDPTGTRTRHRIRQRLAEDGYLYRFRHDGRRLGDAEGAFLLCGQMMALACEADGDRAEALRWFERGRAACGPPGLYAEEYDVLQRQLRGNVPQAFVHALLLETSVRLR